MVIYVGEEPPEDKDAIWFEPKKSSQLKTTSFDSFIFIGAVILVLIKYLGGRL